MQCTVLGSSTRALLSAAARITRGAPRPFAQPKVSPDLGTCSRSENNGKCVVFILLHSPPAGTRRRAPRSTCRHPASPSTDRQVASAAVGCAACRRCRGCWFLAALVASVAACSGCCLRPEPAGATTSRRHSCRAIVLWPVQPRALEYVVLYCVLGQRHAPDVHRRHASALSSFLHTHHRFHANMLRLCSL